MRKITLLKYQRQRSTLPGYELPRNGGGVCIYVRSKSEYQLPASL